MPEKLAAAPEPKGKPLEVEGQQEQARQVRKAVGMEDKDESIRITTPVNDAIFDQGSIDHILTRTDSSRYRFAHLIRPTLEDPNEVWSTRMTNDEVRVVYVKQFPGKGNAVVVETTGNRVITTIPTSKQKQVNRWRNGQIVFEKEKKRGEKGVP